MPPLFLLTILPVLHMWHLLPLLGWLDGEPQTSQPVQGAGDRCSAAPRPGKCPLFARPQLLCQDSALPEGTNAGSNAWTLLGHCEEQREQPAIGFVTTTPKPRTQT